MKKIRRFIAIALVIAALLSLGAFPAFAEEPTGLGAFDSIATMTNTTFSDLVGTHWAYSGIKVCYDKGILVGYPDGTFHPEENVNWAHAVTIAARVHSIYHGILLDDTLSANDEWYSPYYRYCSKHGLIPSGGPSLAQYDIDEINRYDMAYIFSRVVDGKDLPPISSLQMPDLGSVPSKYLSSVQTMYSAGIMNGLDENRFNGKSSATRAQIAEVIARILNPFLREGYDAKINWDMKDYESNIEKESVMVQLGEEFFCLYKYYTGPSTEEYAFIRADGKGEHHTLYTCKDGEYLSNVSAYEGKIYFCKSTSGTASGSLYCYDPYAEKLSVVYSGYTVRSYCFYDGRIYALVMTQFIKNNMNACLYDFGEIKNGSFETKLNSYVLAGEQYRMNYYNIQYMHPYGWNGKIYFKLSFNGNITYLFSYDISTGAVAQVMSKNINSSFFDGHVMYFLAYDEKLGHDRHLYAISVETPGVVSTIGEFPQTSDSQFRSIYKVGDTVYCLANRDVYSMDRSGATRIALITGGAYNAMCFTKDKAVLLPNSMTVDNANEIKIYNAKTLSARDQYGDWLGMSCYYVGRHFEPPADKTVYSTSTSVSSVSSLKISISEAYFNGDDLVIVAKYNNETGNDIKLRSYIVNVAIGGTVVAKNVNRMSGVEMKDHGIETVTFVIGSDEITGSFNLDNPALSIQVIPTYDIVVKPPKPPKQ